MSNCVQCGSPVPKGQHTCSMCYGDPDHGRDGYYREWMEEQVRQAQDNDAAQRQEIIDEHEQSDGDDTEF